MNRHQLPRLLALGAAALSAGCITVGPDYEPPDLAAPDAWTSAVEQEMSREVPDLEAWWTALGDTTLSALIAQADTASLDLAAALARLQEARAATGVEVSARARRDRRAHFGHQCRRRGGRHRRITESGDSVRHEFHHRLDGNQRRVLHGRQPGGNSGTFGAGCPRGRGVWEQSVQCDNSRDRERDRRALRQFE